MAEAQHKTCHECPVRGWCCTYFINCVPHGPCDCDPKKHPLPESPSQCASYRMDVLNETWEDVLGKPFDEWYQEELRKQRENEP